MRRLRSPLARLGLPALLVGAIGLVAATVLAASNIDPLNRSAWSENIGWINSNPSSGGGVKVSSSALTGYVWTENKGWISLSCSNTGSCGTVNYGVTNDGAGNLKGMGWGENIGWVNFSCQTNVLCGGSAGKWGVTIDPATGDFHGEAWGENTGWIRFNCADDASCGATGYKTKTTWGALGCSPFADCDHDPLFPTVYGDGCPDAEEPSKNIGGVPLDANNPWDFYSVPVPALLAAPSPATTFRTNTISAGGAQAVFAYFKAGAKTGAAVYEQDLNLNGVRDGWEYDRKVAGLGPTLAPDGVIGAAEAQKAFAEFKAALKCTSGSGYRKNGP